MGRRGTGEKRRERPTEFVCLDFGGSGLKALRLRRVREQLHLLGADILAPIPIDRDRPADRAYRLNLPAPVQARYAAIAIDSPQTRLRLVAAPAASEGVPLTNQLREQMGLEDGDRLAFLPVGAGPQTPPSRILAAAIPEAEIRQVLALTATGTPAPTSLQPSGLAAFNAFLRGPGEALDGAAALLVETGARATYVYAVNGGLPVLVRRHDRGAEAVIEHLNRQLGVDRDLAQAVLADGAVDVSAAFHQVMGPLFKQLCIARDFVERQESCAVRHLFVSGGLGCSRLWRESLSELLGLPAATWDPLAVLVRSPGSYPDRLRGEEWRFAAAVGAGIGELERDEHVPH